jgi:dihydroxyacetone kinase
LDAPADAPGWKWSSGSPPRVIAPAESISVAAVAAAEGNHKLKALHPQVFTTSIERACRALIAAEAEITRMDSIVGDGDCGLTLKVG